MKTREQIQSEALAELDKTKTNATIAISPGLGKTLIGIKTIYKYYTPELKALVVAPKRSIFTEWNKELEKHGYEFLKPHITYSTYLSLEKCSYDYDIIILDEIHSVLNRHAQWLRLFKGKVLGLTGTPPRYGNTEKGQIINNNYPVVYKYITDEAIDDGILNKYKIIVHKLPLDTSKNIKVTFKDRTWYTSEVESYDYWTKRINECESKKDLQILRIMRMKALMSFKTKTTYTKNLIENIGDKVIVFANEVTQAKDISDITYTSHNTEVINNENLSKFDTGKVSTLVCINQLSEGINIRNLKNAIIMHAYSNERKTSQRLSRTLRLSPDECSTIHILCYSNTVDEEWVKSALKDYNSENITW